MGNIKSGWRISEEVGNIKGGGVYQRGWVISGSKQYQEWWGLSEMVGNNMRGIPEKVGNIYMEMEIWVGSITGSGDYPMRWDISHGMASITGNGECDR